MTAPDRWVISAGRTSKRGCRICQGPRLPGAKLCAPCKAALKRARQVTVSELVPRPKRVRTESRSAKRKKTTPAEIPVAAQPAKALHRTWNIPVLVLAATAVVSGGYLAHWLARPADVPTFADPVSLPMPRLTPTAAMSEPRPAPGNDMAAPESGPLAVVPAEPKRSTTPAASPVTPGVATTAKPTKSVQKRVVEAPPAPGAPVVARFASATEPPPAPAPVVVPPVQEAPPPDRWQVMADTIARCGREGFFSRVVCEQRVRLQYCDGYWGQVAQCPSNVNNDHGN
jgi:hypothetical protein